MNGGVRHAEPALDPVPPAPPVRAALAADAALLVGSVVWAVVAGLGGSAPAWFPWVAALWALATLVTTAGSLGGLSGAMVWRRRLGLLAVLAAVWRGGPIEGAAARIAIVVWTAAIWVVLILEGARLARRETDAGDVA